VRGITALGEVIDFLIHLNKLKAAVAANSDGVEGLPAELRNPLNEFYRLIGGAIDAAQSEKNAEPLVNALSANLILALIEIDWMRTKRAYLPSDLRAQWEAIVASSLVGDRPEGT